MTDARLATDPDVQTSGRVADLVTVVRAQRKTLVVALVLVVAGFWVLGPLGEWALAGCLAAGIGLGVVNHLVTELWLKRVIAGGQELPRNRLAPSTFLRLTLLSVVAVAIAVAFWPDGVGVLFGLAIFRLITLVMTTIPLLR